MRSIVTLRLTWAVLEVTTAMVVLPLAVTQHDPAGGITEVTDVG